MNTNLSEIICILDRSGSMSSIRNDAIGGFNTFLESQKAVPGEARLTLVLFDDQYDVVHRAAPLKQVPGLDEATFVPRGTTALLDAIGRTVDDVGRRLAAIPEADRPGKVIVAILTDGMENSSRRYTRDRVFDMIRHQQDVYSWEFIFLAANQDAIATAAGIGIDAHDASPFVADGEGTLAAFNLMSSETSKKRLPREGK
jgi:uncharacterized protein YegL